ncbi:mitochondrial 50S ribosomal protein L36, putative [Pediculus humanus corporis]|uniref:Ribosomal protein n=1 Tax=Pediculus humanus subsp. corporis TaxID=121224 RepID=E0V9F5_PEDHC|nr:mitochondrial 50S ribosomal protein L36, putative [Pediculus humanus corporis]EEB10011.1 mitochondrial 50S ribosomal protein L36, putative [Pediculus humanus corporis]
MICNNNLKQSKEFSCLSNIKNTVNLSCTNLSIVPSCGMKVRAKLERRCKSCYFARIDGRMMVLCDSYGRHKQMALVKKAKHYWILSHCTQHKIRPY